MRIAKVIFYVALCGLEVGSHFREAQAATYKCWTNKEGVKECGNAVPPEFAQQGHISYSGDGLAVKKQQAAKTAEQFAEEQRLATEKAANERRAQVQANADRVLLQTFSSADDVVLARDGRISTVTGQIKLAESHLQKVDMNLSQLLKSAADLERGGKPVPTKLVDDIESVRKQLTEGRTFIQQKRQEIDDIRQKFDADLQRWKELQVAR